MDELLKLSIHILFISVGKYEAVLIMIPTGQLSSSNVAAYNKHSCKHPRHVNLGKMIISVSTV